jgi:hypothetical protein
MDKKTKASKRGAALPKSEAEEISYLKECWRGIETATPMEFLKMLETELTQATLPIRRAAFYDAIIDRIAYRARATAQMN